MPSISFLPVAQPFRPCRSAPRGRAAARLGNIGRRAVAWPLHVLFHLLHVHRHGDPLLRHEHDALAHFAIDNRDHVLQLLVLGPACGNSRTCGSLHSLPRRGKKVSLCRDHDGRLALPSLRVDGHVVSRAAEAIQSLRDSREGHVLEPRPITSHETRAPITTSSVAATAILAMRFMFLILWKSVRGTTPGPPRASKTRATASGGGPCGTGSSAQGLGRPVQQIVAMFVLPIFHLCNPHSSAADFASTSTETKSSRNRCRARCSSTPTALVVTLSRRPISR